VRGINKKMILLPILLMSMLATMIAVKPTLAQGTTLSLSPVMSTGNIGDTFTVDVMITDVVDLYGYEFKVIVNDPSVVAVTSIDVGNFMPTPPGYAVWKLDVGDGSYAWLAVTRPLASASGVTGSGRLATIHFDVIGTGGTYLVLTSTVLGDPFGNPIAHTVSMGYFSNVVPTTMLADIRKRRSTNRPGEYIFKFPAMGTTQTLMGEVENLGTVPINVRVRFEVFDEAGLPPPGGAIYYSATVVLGAGQAVVLTAGMPIDSSMASFRYYVTNYAEFDNVGDGLTGATGATTRSYSFLVAKE